MTIEIDTQLPKKEKKEEDNKKKEDGSSEGEKKSYEFKLPASLLE